MEATCHQCNMQQQSCAGHGQKHVTHADVGQQDSRDLELLPLGCAHIFLSAALQGAVQQPVAEVMATEENKRKDLQGKVGRLQSLRVNVSAWTAHARTEHACHTCSRRFASQAEQDAFIARKARLQGTVQCQACHECLIIMHHHTSLFMPSSSASSNGVNH